MSWGLSQGYNPSPWPVSQACVPSLAASLVIMASDPVPSPTPASTSSYDFDCLRDKFQTLPVAQAKNLAFALATLSVPHTYIQASSKPKILNLTPPRPRHVCQGQHRRGAGPQGLPAGLP